MVYEPGGYSFLDYIKFGLPLQVLCGVFTVAIVFSMDYWWVYALVLAVLSPAAVVALFFCRGRDALSPSESASDADGDKGPAAADLVALEEAKLPTSPLPLPSAGPSAAGVGFA
jgi:hypothetical protein